MGASIVDHLEKQREGGGRGAVQIDSRSDIVIEDEGL